MARPPDRTSAPAAPRRVAVIINPKSGAGARPEVARARARLAAQTAVRHGWTPEVFVTERPGHARALAEAAVRRGVDVVVAWGGDGTANEVGSALAFTGTPMAIVPSGSGNGLARDLGISRRPERALEVALAGDTRRIDVGELAGRLFVNLAGVGFDALVASEFAASRRRGWAGYAWLTLAHLTRYRPRVYTIDTAEGHRTIEALFVCFANSRQFGNGAIIAADARVDDGVLNLVVVGSRPAWRALCAVPALFRGRVARVRDVWSVPFEEIRVSAGGDVLFHVDGEPARGGPTLTARVHAGALSVRVPAGVLPSR